MNELLNKTEIGSATFFSAIIFSYFAFYLLMCTLKGLVKFGLRIFIFFPVHPMKQNATWMNSFLFNIMILMMATLAVCHFLAEAFSNYMRLTQLGLLFSTMIKNMDFFKFFFKNNVFVWILLVRSTDKFWTCVTLIYLAVKPRTDRLDLKKKYQELKVS